ncbi:MAG: 4Fe-4S binding protein [Methanobrevibacter sp.]|uniref:4Fe-4S binding protein n=1 Tax=Methanobrevibacter sp. TaxID=66852 RepID=UPI003183D4A8|nr:4Fe-4S binding protein [Methanobrevibacter sp.]
MSVMIDSYTKTPRPLRYVDVDYLIDQTKCANCKDKPCLNSCPIDAIYTDEDEGLIKIKNTCFGCVLCRNACPYDAISLDVHMDPPIKENVPNINVKLCKACGACVQACKNGSIHIVADGKDEPHSEIDKDTCVRCGYCFRVCPTDAIKYGQLLPKTVKGGKAVVVNQDNCIGCMTCTRVCPSMGALNVARTNKLPYINPGYCARCEECMHSCPSGAIKYSSRKKAYKMYSEIKSFDIVSEIVDHDIKILSLDLISLNKVLEKVGKSTALEFNDLDFENFVEYKVNDAMERELRVSIDSSIEVDKFTKLFGSYLMDRNIEVYENKCVACGECFNVCPVGAIEQNGPSPIVINDDCVYCGKCVEQCQFDAIGAYDDYFYSKDTDLYYARSYLYKQRLGDFSLSENKCQACAICTKNCPVGALTLNDDKIEFDGEKCIYCRTCEAICPLDAIRIVNFR